MTPGLVYRLARWRRPAAVGSGQLVVTVRGRGSARLYYRGSDGEGRAECVRRQTWALRVPASCAASRVTLREEGCGAEGDSACEYVVTWAEDARVAPAALVGLLAASAVASTGLATAAPLSWSLVPAVTVATYAVERWRVGRANPLANAQSGAAFRSLIGQALGSHYGPAPHRDAGISIEREGDLWRIGYEGATLRLRHSRGLALLAHLVRSPGEEIHVATLDAITPSGGSAVARAAPAPDGGVLPAPGDAGEILDAQARDEYRRRAVELREALEDAGARGDLARAEAMRGELELLEDELRLAVAPGGRARRAGGDAERLRVAITHRIRDAIAQIGQRDPGLGAHLTASVSTGYRCVYEPAKRPTSAERGAPQRQQRV